MKPSTLTSLSIFLNISFLSILGFCFYANVRKPSVFIETSHRFLADSCVDLHQYVDYESKCVYVTTQASCKPRGMINYLGIFYCNCSQFPGLGYSAILLWLGVLFYMLATTASNYFCPSLESLSVALNLSPIVAGTTLLPLGNGASDVFASVAAFTRSGDGDVGLNGILGGSMFVSSFVVGVISILISARGIKVDEPSFIRDVLFFLFSLSSLLMIIIFGRINIWIAIGYASIYLIYIFLVSSMHLFCNKRGTHVPAMNNSPDGITAESEDQFEEMTIPLVNSIDLEKPNQSNPISELPIQKHATSSESNHFSDWFVYVLELPLTLPRKLTIPVASEEKWSQPYAVVSVTIAPIFLAALWSARSGEKGGLAVYTASGLIGLTLGGITFASTSRQGPPKRCAIALLVGGFLMSVTWTYLIAEELVSLLVSIGHILGISSSTLGLTVLAWGNSVGDLISDVAIAMSGGPDGVQIAISGCYAGPLFSTLVGLGASLVVASWSEYPSTYVIPKDPYLYETVGFLVGCLLWALVILPNKNMKVDRFLGFGLLAIYFCFLFLRFARLAGFLNLVE